jgi:soluble lytic murein transglycosylase-like protein
MYNKIKYWYLIILSGIIGALFYNIDRRLDYFEERLELAAGTTSLQMYESIEHWSDSFGIPKHIAYNVAYLETRYQGPFDFDYNHKQKSSAGAVGPMQVITKWAHRFAGKRISERELRNNIDLNVMISMKMLRKWYSIYHDWTLACGAYNTGQPVRNGYAQYATTNTNYKNKWNKL